MRFVSSAQAASVLASVELNGAPVALEAFSYGQSGQVLAAALGAPGTRHGVALLTRQDSGWSEALFLETPDLRPIDLVAHDADGQGAPEIAVLCHRGAGDGQGTLLVLGADATGWSTRSRGTTGLRPFAVAAGDWDGDGLDDLAVGAQNSHHVNLFHTTPTGLVRLADLGLGRGVLDVLAEDLDGDGSVDVAGALNFAGWVGIAFNRR